MSIPREPSRTQKPIASLSIDLDNKWAYLRAAGREDWQQRPGYLDLVTPRIVDVLGELGLPLTVFLVGRDLAEPSDVDSIRRLADLPAWEPANHSLNHLPWMHTMGEEEIRNEIMTTHDRIVSTIGQRPKGFRGPGFSCPSAVLSVLASNGYAYDASVFPTSIAPIARAWFLMKSDLRGEEREKAKKLYGGFASLMQPNAPFERSIDGRTMWEIPVTTMPIFRTPIHFSYVTFLASFSTLAAKAYFKMALSLCRWTGTSPSLLLHPPDFMGCEDDTDMAYFPGMKLTRAKKLEITRWGLKQLDRQFDVRLMIDQVQSLQPVPALATP